MNYDKPTMTFKNLSKEDKNELLDVCKDIILKGKIDFSNRFIKTWLENSKFDENQSLIVSSTVMPQRLLLSLFNE